jgi:hypothetical protein
VSKRNLFVSFAESDGGHSYLAMRSMLDANSVGHLIFRTTVSDALDTVVAGQANCAVVPFYNSITQWDGATLKALATGQFEVHAQMCMPTSYVLAAHKEYMAEFVDRYRALSGRDDDRGELSPERAKKIYTRFLTRIFVNADAEAQYRGRLMRPDMAQATIEHTRNPLRVLEEISRNELVKDLQTGVSRNARAERDPGFGASPLVFNLTQPRTGTISELNVPAVLIAAGLLDGREDNDGWDRHGSVGEIISLLKNLLELLDVYSFGAPDLPENRTKYLLISKKGMRLPKEAILADPKAKARTLVLARTQHRRATADQWLRPRERLLAQTEATGCVFDRAPIAIETGSAPVFLFEGGYTKSSAPKAKPAGWFGWFKTKAKSNSLQETVEKKPERKPGKGSPDDSTLVYLGEYGSWCGPGLNHGEACSCGDEPVAETGKDNSKDWRVLLTAGVALLLVIGALYLAYAWLYCPLTGQCAATTGQSTSWQPNDPVTAPPPAQTLPAQQPPGTPYPGQPFAADAPATTIKAPAPAYPGMAAPGTSPNTAATPGQPPTVAGTAGIAMVKPMVLHIAFHEAKSNLTRESFDTLASAAAQAMESRREVDLRIFALGPRETDQGLWRRRVSAVKDELVRLGVPFQRLQTEGTGPYVLRIQRVSAPTPRTTGASTEQNFDQGSLDDPFSGE